MRKCQRPAPFPEKKLSSISTSQQEPGVEVIKNINVSPRLLLQLRKGMDTAAYLTRQGWLGSGHSLDPSGRGITKPLFVSKKFDLLGLGMQENDIHTNQWWAKGFDRALGHLNVGTDGATDHREQNALKTRLQPLERNAHGSPKRGMGSLKDGLYVRFVQGEGLRATHTADVVEQGKTNSRQNIRSTGNGDERCRRLKRLKHKSRKGEARTETFSFSRNSNSLTPKTDVYKSETSKKNLEIVKRESEIEGEQESRVRTEAALINIRSHSANVARNPATKIKFPRKTDPRRCRRGDKQAQKISSGYD
ncbi:hypothetical protein MMC07_003093 [Pseudocyphellaria aurata]|nr:hypothetical protein [Pseudocyphellaria aurata]